MYFAVDPGHPIFDPATIQTIIAGIGVLALLLTGAMVPLTLVLIRIRGQQKSTADDVGVVRYQVENNHSINLRDDADQKHTTATAGQDTISAKIDAGFNNIDTRFNSVDRRLDVQSEQILRVSDRTAVLEATQPASTVRTQSENLVQMTEGPARAKPACGPSAAQIGLDAF